MELPTLLRYFNGEFHNTMADLTTGDAVVTAMTTAPGGNLIVASRKWGVALLYPTRLETLAGAGSLPRSPIISLAAASNGDIWIGTREEGLARLQGRKVSTFKEGLPDRKIDCLLPGPDGELWVGTGKGIVRWDGRELSNRDVPPALRRLPASAMVRDRDSNIWFGSGTGGLFRLNSHGLAKLEPVNGPATGTATAIFEDREGDIWIGSDNGIERLRDSVFVTYSTSEGLPSGHNGPVFVDARGRVWSAAASGGVYWLKEGEVTNIAQAGLARDVVYSISGRGDDIWIGRQRGGLTHFRWHGDSFTATTYTQADGLARNSVYAVHQCRDGTVWAGTLTGGVSRLRDGRFATFTTADGLASNTVTAIAEGSEGTVWFGTPNGVTAFLKDRWRTYGIQDGLPSRNVNSLLEDRAGVLWLGTSRGLAFLESGSVQEIRDAPPVLREQIFGLAEDREGFLWIATSNHILRAARDQLLRGTAVVADLHEYGPGNGLRGTEGVRRQCSVAVDSLGRIWFSVSAGLAVVDPSRLMNSKLPAFVRILKITADSDTIGMSGPVRIPAGHQRITIAYTALNLAAPERTLFRYRLNGFDRGWSAPVAVREWSYTNLNPAAYRFEVLASNSDGIFNGGSAGIDFSIAPAYYQTHWFQASCVAAFLLSLWVVHRFRLHQIAQEFNIRLEERVGERTRIARELHDTLLQSFQALMFHFQAVKDLLPPGRGKEALERVLDRADQAIVEGREAIQNLRSSTKVTNELSQAMAALGEELAGAKMARAVRRHSAFP